MKLHLRIVALAFGAIVLVGLIPDTINIQTSRTTSFTISAPDNSDLLTLHTHRPADVSSVTQSDNSTESIRDTVSNDTDAEQRAAQLEAIARPRPYESLELYIHLPPDAAKNQPLRVLIVLHGMGGVGNVFSQSLIAEADKNRWLLIAPTLPYGDYMDPSKLLIEDLRYSGLLADMLEYLPRKLGLKLRRHALVYGFSRGAQLAHRFALFYPERVESIAAISAGSFTLPNAHKNNDYAAPLLQMPYGVGDLDKYIGHTLKQEDLKKVSFLVEVGENDNAPDEVPWQFNTYVGKNRVERASAFQRALVAVGVQARLMIFSGTGHEITNEMRISALQFLRNEELAKKLND